MPALPFRPRFFTPAALVVVVSLSIAACGSSSTTTADSGGGTTAAPTLGAVSAASVTPATTGTTPGTTKAGPTTTTTTSTKAGSPTTATASTTTAPGTDPGTLPQTDDNPTASGTIWESATEGLWDAIVTDDPSKARPFFFPLSAYKQVKAISNPEHDYETRLIAYFEEDIHALHKQLGSSADQASFVRIDVPATALWIKPGVEYNKGAYWRVQDSKLIYRIGDSQKSFVVKSMISWRGEWYVVHLTSIR